MTTDALIAELRRLLGPEAVFSRPEELAVYECDAYTVPKMRPEAVVLPRNTDEVAAVVRLCARARVPFVPRGAGTGLSGGTLPTRGGVMIGLSRMNRIVAVDIANRRAVVEAGLVNLRLTEAVSSRGLCFAPDPSSQMVSTIGGNVAENAGGPHTLKYGVTTNHVLGVELVLPDGEVVWCGAAVEDLPGLDLTGVVVGSEGTFGIVTKAIVRLVPLPQGWRTLLAIFPSIDTASRAVSGILGAGVTPAALEMIDQTMLRAIEEAFHYGFPTDAGAVLLVELDGIEAGLDAQADRVEKVCAESGAVEVRRAHDADERAHFWKARKMAVGTVGRLAPSVATQDGVIPRTKLPEALKRIDEIAARHRVRICHVFHAGDGNLHPVTLFDERDADEAQRVLAAGMDILRVCIDLGGSLTGEHGIGTEKLDAMALMFTDDDLAVFRRVREAFNPDGLCNPGKVVPTGAECRELRVKQAAAPGAWV